MSNKVTTLVVRGKANFAKILGEPVPNYNKDGKEWKMDLVITKDAIKELKAHGIGDRVKTKDEYVGGEPFMSFKQSELKKDGSPNKPITVVDIKGNPWPQDQLIGNGSDVDVKFVVMDFGPGKKKGVYIRAVRVLKLVSYQAKQFSNLDEDDEFFGELDKLLEENEQANAVDFDTELDELNDEIVL